MTRVAALSVRSVVAGYEPTLPVVRGASIEVRQHEIVTLLGPNGAGKSTLLKAISGLLPIAEGTVWLAGTDITAMPAHRMVFNGLALVPQTENIFATLSCCQLDPASLRQHKYLEYCQYYQV